MFEGKMDGPVQTAAKCYSEVLQHMEDHETSLPVTGERI